MFGTSSAPKPTFNFGSPSNPAQTGSSSGAPVFSFGQSQPQQQQQQQPPTAANTTGGSLFNFGASTQQPQQQQQQPFGGSKFNFNTQQQPQQSFFSSNQPSFVSQPQQPLQQQQFQQATTSLNKTTRVSDLPIAAQTQIEQLDIFIQSQVDISEDLSARKEQINDFILSVVRDTEEVQRRYSITSSLLQTDSLTLRPIREFSTQLLENSRKVLRALDMLRNPSLSTTSRSANYRDPVSDFFESTLMNSSKQIKLYSRTLQELETVTRRLEEDSYASPDTASALKKALQMQFDLFTQLANRIAGLHEEVNKLGIK